MTTIVVGNEHMDRDKNSNSREIFKRFSTREDCFDFDEKTILDFRNMIVRKVFSEKYFFFLGGLILIRVGASEGI